MTVRLFHNPQSRAVMIEFLLEEIGCPYELVPVEYGDGSMRTPEFLSISPLGKIPAIEDGEVKMAETAAIAIYLADKYKTPNDLAPAIDDPRRGRFLFWTVFQTSGIDNAMMHASAKFEVPRQAAGWGGVQEVVELLESQLSQTDPYLLGDWFTAADVVVGSALNWAKNFNLLPLGEATLAYAARVAARPAAQRLFGGA